MASVITLTTDFGLNDGYVAAMKGVILSINPDVILVDVSHTIRHQNVREGAFVLGTAYRYFPEGTIHVAIVDPGVGTARRGLVLKGAGYYFVAPDNGVLSYVLADAVEQANPAPHHEEAGSPEDEKRNLPSGFEAVALTKRRYWCPTVSDTFHGRDIFAPVAAHLSLKVPLGEFGEPISSLLAFPRPCPTATDDGAVQGEVVHIDGFGNLITNVRAEGLPTGEVEIEVAGHRIDGISRSYQEGEGLLAIFGSAGYLEVSERNGSAASRIGAEIGTPVIVRPLGG
ncbi:MAG: S-adenosyl-l-methionine hydroxide adenosyltransferase family protein [Dehalococcoidia bacterium]